MRVFVGRFQWAAALSALLATGCGSDSSNAPRSDDSPAATAPDNESALASQGPYGVSTREFTFIDSARGTPANGAYAGAADRTLPTRVWYPTDPADDGTSGAEPSSEGPFPVVLFAHPFLGSRADFAPLKEHLASHGYVVIAPDFPSSSAGAAGGPTPADLGNQPGDLGFVAEQVRGLGGADTAFAAALDVLRTGVVGQPTYPCDGAARLTPSRPKRYRFPTTQMLPARWSHRTPFRRRPDFSITLLGSRL